LVFIFFRGILLFLIFGSNERPALFLPFCYYAPPGAPQFPRFTPPDEIISFIELSPMPDVHLRQDDKIDMNVNFIQ
jgi:hypothetical protein